VSLRRWQVKFYKNYTDVELNKVDIHPRSLVMAAVYLAVLAICCALFGLTEAAVSICIC